jgi:hypothetical protein
MKNDVNHITSVRIPAPDEELRETLWSMLEKRLRQQRRKARSRLHVSLVREWKTNERRGF